MSTLYKCLGSFRCRILESVITFLQDEKIVGGISIPWASEHGGSGRTCEMGMYGLLLPPRYSDAVLHIIAAA